MAKDGTVNLMECLRRAVLAGSKADRTDGQLLEDYLSRRDEAAVAALIRRHGPMVWGVCRRVLRNHQDAEDAFQATFLVLVRKAASVVQREMVGNWLYGVAHQTALKARTTAAKRQARERQVADVPEPAARPEADLWADLEPLLDQELSRLPDKYRVAVVLCDLEGKTRKEAARQLKIPEGTLSTRLRTARAMLAKRLARHGLAVSGGALAAVLSRNAASAGVPTSVAYPSIKAVTMVAAGRATTGAISVKVAALTEGAMKAMLFNKLKSAIAVVLILGLMATGATLLTYRTAAGQDERKPATEKQVEPAAKKEKDEETFTAWGKEVDGLQAGLCFPPGQQRAYHYGETVTLIVRVRNVGKEEVKFQYLKEFLDFENPLMVTDVDGKTMPQGAVLVGGPDAKHVPVEMSLAAGKEIELGTKQFILRQAGRPDGNIGPVCPPLQVGTGKVSVQFDRVFGNTHAGRIKVDPDLLKLTTGKLELEIKDAKKGEDKMPPAKETAWGKEVQGLQAGVRLVSPAEAIHKGDSITFEFVVRNVGKEDATVKYISATGWTCSVDKPGRLVFGPAYSGGRPITNEKVLRPGEQWDMTQISLLTRQPTPREGTSLWTPLEPGKYKVSCPSVLMQEIPSPKEGRLATGDLDLEILPPVKEPRGKVKEDEDAKTGPKATGVDPATSRK